METTEFRAAFAGACYNNGKSICVEEPKLDLCDANTFHSAHFLRGNPGHELRYCAGEIENVNIGRCAVGTPCSNLASRCSKETEFIPYDTDCTIVLDHKLNQLTIYGKCGNRCSWSEEDCLPGEVWTNFDTDCTADQVQIGACFAGHAFCAVSKESCINPVEPFLTHEEVREQKDVNCYLAAIPQPTSAPVPTVPLVPPPTFPAPTFAPQVYTVPTSQAALGGNLESYSSGKGDGLSQGGILGIAILVAIFIGVFVGVIGYREALKRRQSQARMKEEEEITHEDDVPPPVNTIDASQRQFDEMYLDDDI